MARQAYEGFVFPQQAAGDAAVRVVADQAVLGNRLMLVDPGPPLLLVAAIAEVVGSTGSLESPVFVGVVAAYAVHCPFEHRMMRGHAKLGHFVGMALQAKRRFGTHVAEANVRLAEGLLMDGVAVHADQVGLAVFA
jgi:hypothetical protein